MIESIENINILFVEDEDAAREYIKKMLNRIMPNVFSASNAKEALEIFDNNRIDILISDIKMPVVSGVELAKEIKNRKPEIEIIFTTSANEEEYFIESIKIGVLRYILKPIDFDDLKEAIDVAIKNIDTKKKAELYIQERIKKSQNSILAEMIDSLENPIFITGDNMEYSNDSFNNQFKEQYMENINTRTCSLYPAEKKQQKIHIEDERNSKTFLMLKNHISGESGKYNIYSFTDVTDYEESRRELIKSNLDILFALGNAAAKRDNESDDHNYRVAYYSASFGEYLGISKKDLKTLIKGAFLHDVGKIGISDTILLKPGKLDKGEFEIMKTHVSLGLEIVEDIEFLKDARHIIEFHHERYDGNGYLKGLNGDKIPYLARVFSVIDVFDALTSQRPYKRAFSHDESIKIITQEEPHNFDPEILRSFTKISADIYNEVFSINSDKLREMTYSKIHKYFKS